MAVTEDSWRLSFWAGYIVHPGHGLSSSEIDSAITGSSMDVAAIPGDYFTPLFDSAPSDCRIDIAFRPENGKAVNMVRNFVRQLAFDKGRLKQAAAHEMARRLASATTHRSPEGLLIFLVGRTHDRSRVLMWKFPADEILQARVSKEGMDIQLLKDAFSRRSKFFKAAMFEGRPSTTSLWTGKVQDNQAKSATLEVAKYWIEDFLLARPAMSDVRGSKILGRVVREALRKSPPHDQDAILNAVSSVRTQTDRRISLTEFAETYLPEPLREEFVSAPEISDIADEVFRIDEEALREEIRFKSLVIDGRFMIRGPAEDFDSFVSVDPTDEEGVVKISLVGRITDRKLLKR